VQLKRDLLGASANLSISVVTTIPDTSLAVRGKLLLLDRDWVVLDTGADGKVWVPMQNVLLLQF
jgi:hypothetical protein